MLSFISPNTFLNGDYFVEFRSYLTRSGKISEILDFRDFHVFQDPTVFVCTICCQRLTDISFPYEYTHQVSDSSFETTVKYTNVIHGPDTISFKPSSGPLDRLAGVPGLIQAGSLFYIKDVGINYWTQGRGKTRGGSIGERVLYSGEQRDKRDIPFLKGRDVTRFCVSEPKNFLIYDHPEHLDSTVDTLRFSPVFLEIRPKIVYRQTANRIIAALDTQGRYLDKTVHLIVNKETESPIDLRFVLALLNSSLFAELYCDISQEGEHRAFAQVKTTYLKKLPIRIAGEKDQESLIALVQQCLDAKAADPNADISHWEAEIDARVEFLYFHQDEAPTYDDWLAMKEAEKGTVIEEIRNLLAIGHETLEFECKSSFSWDIKKQEHADWLKDEVHTAICAMLNAKGGDVLVGVDDDMNILGLDKDLEKYGNKDKLVQAIENPLGKTLVPNPINLVTISPINIDGKTIIRIQVKPDSSERYKFKDGIYVRRNSKSKPALTAEEAATWWSRRKEGSN